MREATQHGGEADGRVVTANVVERVQTMASIDILSDFSFAIIYFYFFR